MIGIIELRDYLQPQNPLELAKIGVLIPKGFGIRKLRVRNSDLKKGKSGSYRLLYFYKEPPQPVLYLLLLYLKSDQSNVTHETLMELLNEIPFEDKE